MWRILAGYVVGAASVVVMQRTWRRILGAALSRGD